MILADNLIALNVTEAERNSTVIADVSRGNHGTVRDAVENHAFV
jgi:hypothetical protein